MNTKNTKPVDHKKVYGAGYHAGVAAKTTGSPDSLIGCSFHNFTEDGVIHNQGRILSEIAPGKYLVQLYSFMDGRETVRKIVPLAEMEQWAFYPSDDEMNIAYEAKTRAELRAEGLR